jgi:raffinose synthase
LSGYWGGISENIEDDLPKSLSSNVETSDAQKVKISFPKPTPHLLKVEPALAWDPSSLAGCGTVAIDQLNRLYNAMHEYLADAGIDGVKVDAQSGIAQFGVGNGGGSRFARACVSAVETSVKKAFNKGFCFTRVNANDHL